MRQNIKSRGLLKLTSQTLFLFFFGNVLGPSKFYATKWEGENAVREEFPDAIIFRPSDMYGQSDRFLLYYAGNARRYVNVVPLWKSGKGIYKAPVYVQDVAKAVVKAVFEKGNEGTVSWNSIFAHNSHIFT